MLIDDYLPDYDFDEKHDIAIEADARRVYEALNEVDFSESAIVRWLLRLRGMTSSGLTLRSLSKSRFKKLDERPGNEMVIGLIGRFWTVFGDLQNIDSAGSFKKFAKPGYAKTAWNFSLAEDRGQTRLATETRIKCLDDASRRSFGRYWFFIEPFSGLIRMEMLKTIKRKAEIG